MKIMEKKGSRKLVTFYNIGKKQTPGQTTVGAHRDTQ